MSTVELEINGHTRTVTVTDPDTPLAYVLRNQLDLTGTRIGCALEQCGACAVMVDGRSRLSCATPASTFRGRTITTVEGLAGRAAGRRVQAAFVSTGAAQCGFCSAGILVALTAALESNPKASRHDLREALVSHLCRCGAHPRVLAAIDTLVSDAGGTA